MIELIKIYLLDYRVLAYEANVKDQRGTVLNIWV
jgi:hypothetical protein